MDSASWPGSWYVDLLGGEMKLINKEPTPEMLAIISNEKEVFDSPELLYAALYDAAPDIQQEIIGYIDGHYGFVRTKEGINMAIGARAYAYPPDAQAEITRLNDLIEEQKGTITALNMALGGEDSTSTENLIDAYEVDYNEEGLISLCRKLIAENVRLSDVIESTAINDTIEALGFANREIERLTTSENDWITCHAKIWRELQETKTIVGNQAERISDLEASPISEEVIDILRSKIKALESEILDQCRINGMGAEREATLLGKVERQSAALKLAREALFDMQDSYAAVHGWKDSFVIAATTALAAIDEVLKGE